MKLVTYALLIPFVPFALVAWTAHANADALSPSLKMTQFKGNTLITIVDRSSASAADVQGGGVGAEMWSIMRSTTEPVAFGADGDNNVPGTTRHQYYGQVPPVDNAMIESTMFQDHFETQLVLNPEKSPFMTKPLGDHTLLQVNGEISDALIALISHQETDFPTIRVEKTIQGDLTSWATDRVSCVSIKDKGTSCSLLIP